MSSEFPLEGHLSRLRARGLLREAMYVDDTWIADDANPLEVVDPATRAVIAHVPDGGAESAREAVAAAARALPAWRALTAKARSEILLRWHGLLLEHLEDLATLLTLEQGKPLAEARAEIAYGAAFVSWFAAEACRVYGDIIPATQSDRRLFRAGCR